MKSMKEPSWSSSLLHGEESPDVFECKNHSEDQVVGYLQEAKKNHNLLWSGNIASEK